MLPPLRPHFLRHTNQGALGAYTGVTYIDMKEGERKKSEEKGHSWELDR